MILKVAEIAHNELEVMTRVYSKYAQIIRVVYWLYSRGRHS